MRTIKGQTIASTTLDLHGDKITKEELLSLFNQMPAEQAVNLDHDLSKPIVGRMYNKQFVEIEGEFSIKIDVDVFNEDEFAKRGGFSIAFFRRRLTINSSREGDITILFNPVVIDSDDVKSLVSISNKSVQIDAQELVQKSLEVTTVIVIVFVSSSIASGFFKKAGADVYDLLKSKLRELAEKYRANGKGQVRFHFKFTARIGTSSVEVIVESDTDELSIISRQSLLIEPLLKQISAYTESTNIRRISICVRENAPYLEVTQIVDEGGKAVKLLK
ncbi:MAG TPA: hypothetical protein VKB05_17950 [Pyrinomonadaceae bacterium]|nr:hypothetical protein [Pyrinomonadaceae bacterium]